jgi:acetylornithine deacetylase/succinyl-diaminopimelate desuccinylase-like protein
MKAGLISALEAFETIANTDRNFHGELYFVVVSGGQDGGAGTLAAIRRGYSADFAIIPSATASSSENVDLGIMHAGSLSISVSVFPSSCQK